MYYSGIGTFSRQQSGILLSSVAFFLVISGEDDLVEMSSQVKQLEYNSDTSGSKSDDYSSTSMHSWILTYWNQLESLNASGSRIVTLLVTIKGKNVTN